MMAIREEKAAATAAHARALEPVICTFAAGGITSLAGIARALNDGGHPAIQGGLWTSAQVGSLLQRLGVVFNPPVHFTKSAGAARRIATTRAVADARARVIAEISESGVASFADIARQLNGRGITTRQGNVWDGIQVRRVMLRLGIR